MNQIEARRAMTRGGKHWTTLEVLREVYDEDGWRIVAERGHWDDRVERVRVKKYMPSGRFYFCEGLTLSVGAWEQLRR